MIAACSDKDVAPDSSGKTEGSNGYIGIKVQLPTAPITRGLNDDFADGEGTEYSIKDSYVLIFQGGSEADAKCIGTYALQQSDPDKNSSTQVTTSTVRVASVSDIDPNKKLYALVILNAKINGIFGGSKEWMKGKTIQDLQEYVIDNKLFTQITPGKGFADAVFMTNSPLSTYKGGSHDPNKGDNDAVISDIGKLPVLVELKSTVYKTEKEALEKPAGIIHVERAVGKVTCSKFITDTNVEVSLDGTKYNLVVDEIWWDMAQDMDKCFMVRNTDRFTKENKQNKLWLWNYASENFGGQSAYSGSRYRMIGSTELPSKDKDDNDVIFYRPYFCQVPGYGQPSASDEDGDTYEAKTFKKSIMTFSVKPGEETVKLDLNNLGKNAFYPRENTFPVEYMKYANTTRIGFWVTFKLKGGPDIKGKNFYIKGVDKSTIYLDVNGHNPMENLAINELSNSEKYPDIYAEVNAALGNNTVSGLNIGDIINIITETADNGEIRITSVSFKPLSDGIFSTDKYNNKFKTQPDSKVFDSNLLARLNNLGQFYEYTGGKAFYEVRIKHFGDELTPWEVAEEQTASNIEESYGDINSRANNYLGRYGIVRNNWYDLNVNVIKKLGYPQDPAVWDNSWPDKPDDNKDNYIAVELRILSWAKRTQNHEF